MPYFFVVYYTNLIIKDLCDQVKHFIRYKGVAYRLPSSMQYMWLYVQYNDSSRGYVGVSPCSFNDDVLLQKGLESIITHDDWQWLEEKYGFIRIRSKPGWI